MSVQIDNGLIQAAFDEQTGAWQSLQYAGDVDRTHDLDLRVMFDFIPQGVGDSSPFVEQHPDWLVRDAIGRTFGSYG